MAAPHECTITYYDYTASGLSTEATAYACAALVSDRLVLASSKFRAGPQELLNELLSRGARCFGHSG
jgi:hypothetical protein